MPHWLALTLAVILVVISQIKINVTNAYSGSIAWTNSFSRVTKTYPGRIVFLCVQRRHRHRADGGGHVQLPQQPAELLRQLRHRMDRRRRIGHRDQQVPAEDLPEAAGVPPGNALQRQPGRVRLRDRAAGASILVYFHAFGDAIQPYSPIVALVLALVLPPITSRWPPRASTTCDAPTTASTYPMLDADGNPTDVKLMCCVTGVEFERPDMIASAKPGPNGEKQYISSLALSCDKTGEHVLPAQK